MTLLQIISLSTWTDVNLSIELKLILLSLFANDRPKELDRSHSIRAWSIDFSLWVCVTYVDFMIIFQLNSSRFWHSFCFLCSQMAGSNNLTGDLPSKLGDLLDTIMSCDLCKMKNPVVHLLSFLILEVIDSHHCCFSMFLLIHSWSVKWYYWQPFWGSRMMYYLTTDYVCNELVSSGIDFKHNSVLPSIVHQSISPAHKGMNWQPLTPQDLPGFALRHLTFMVWFEYP
jgi:hypothetical protein